MNKSPEVDPLAAFPDPKHPPADAELTEALGPAWPKVGEVLHRLHTAHPHVTGAWQFSARSGWYQVQLLKKRRLLYLVPKRGSFRLMMILGRRAVASLKGGPLSRRVTALLTGARHYPEGIAFEFDPASLDAELLNGLLEAKISPTPAGHENPRH